MNLLHDNFFCENKLRQHRVSYTIKYCGCEISISSHAIVYFCVVKQPNKIPIRQIEKTPGELSRLGNLSIRNLSEMLAGEKLIQDLHRHDFFYVLFIGKGTGCHEIDFVAYEITDQSLFVMRPGQVHQIELTASQGYLLQIGSDFLTDDIRLRKLLQNAGRRNHFLLSDGHFKRLDHTLNNLLDEYNQKRQDYDEAIKSYLSLFFIEIQRQCDGCDAPIAENVSYAHRKLERFLALVEQNMASIKKPSAYAELLHLTPSQLNAITKKLLAKTASDIIAEQILLEAKRLLLASSAQVNQIAYGLGYEDVSYFIRFFKKHSGASPEMFRQNSK